MNVPLFIVSFEAALVASVTVMIMGKLLVEPSIDRLVVVDLIESALMGLAMYAITGNIVYLCAYIMLRDALLIGIQYETFSWKVNISTTIGIVFVLCLFHALTVV